MPFDVMSNYVFELVKLPLSRTIAHDQTYCLSYDIKTTISTLTTRTPITTRLAPPAVATTASVRCTRFKKFFDRKANSQSSVK